MAKQATLIFPVSNDGTSPRRELESSGGSVRVTNVLIALLTVSSVSRGGSSAYFGDSLYGRVTAVTTADAVVFNTGADEYTLRLVGVEAPPERRAAAEAVKFVSGLVLNKPARMRLEGRTREGYLRARLFTADSNSVIREVSVELVRSGMVRRVQNYDFKYGELALAEREARSARRGLWGRKR